MSSLRSCMQKLQGYNYFLFNAVLVLMQRRFGQKVGVVLCKSQDSFESCLQ